MSDASVTEAVTEAVTRTSTVTWHKFKNKRPEMRQVVGLRAAKREYPSLVVWADLMVIDSKGLGMGLVWNVGFRAILVNDEDEWFDPEDFAPEDTAPGVEA